ncbi:hypothetical protein ABID47_002807 [Paenibacillus favisporus]|uniref:PqqD family protein n=1 Tax=Paenibacillus favisporus TaxID=221028 RepID=A0ABV2F348_9BACL
MLGYRKKRKDTAGIPINLLDLVPVLHSKVKWKKTEGIVTLSVPREGWLACQSVKWLKQPAVVQIRLDALGSEVAACCDGSHSVADIAGKLHARFGEQAEPLLPRLVKFIELLEMNDLAVCRPGDSCQRAQDA